MVLQFKFYVQADHVVVAEQLTVAAGVKCYT